MFTKAAEGGDSDEDEGVNAVNAYFAKEKSGQKPKAIPRGKAQSVSGSSQPKSKPPIQT